MTDYADFTDSVNLFVAVFGTYKLTKSVKLASWLLPVYQRAAGFFIFGESSCECVMCSTLSSFVYFNTRVAWYPTSFYKRNRNLVLVPLRLVFYILN